MQGRTLGRGKLSVSACADPGTKQRRYLEENLQSLEIALTPSDLERIEEVAPKGVAACDRYHEAGMRTMDG